MPPTNLQKYSTLSSINEVPFDIEEQTHHEQDAADDSDTTLASSSFLQTSKSRSPSPKSRRSHHRDTSSRRKGLFTWIRWVVVVLLQSVIILLLLQGNGYLDTNSGKWDEKMTETGGDINGLYVPTKHKYTLLTPDEEKFVPDMDSDANRMDIRHNWDMLMPLGSGSVEINDYKNYPMLGKPIVDDPIRNGSLFEASWTHALHCLYYTVDSYHQLTISNGTKFGFDGERNDMHASHCFEYLRNQILCMSDMTLEGSESVLDASGMGQAHMCRDREEAISWIEGRRVDDVQSIVGP